MSRTRAYFFADFPLPFPGWLFGFSPGAGPFGGGESSETSLSPAGYPPFVAIRLRPEFIVCTSPNGSDALVLAGTSFERLPEPALGSLLAAALPKAHESGVRLERRGADQLLDTLMAQTEEVGRIANG